MPRILLVEDSQEVQMIIRAIFHKRAEVVVAKDLSEARKVLKTGHLDLILLDVGLPDGSGFSFLAELNSEGPSSMPVFLLTGNVEDHDKLQAFQLGAHDYITKPFSHVELKARVEACLRRRAEPSEVLVKGNLQLQMTTQRVSVRTSRGNESVELSSIEFKLLAYFLKHEDHVLSRPQIMEAIWGYGVHVLDRTVDAHVSRLRKKLGPSEYNIQTVVGAGYAFRRSDSHASAA